MRGVFLYILILVGLATQANIKAGAHFTHIKTGQEQIFSASHESFLSVNYSFQDIEDDDKDDEKTKEYISFLFNLSFAKHIYSDSPSIQKHFQSSPCPFYILFHSLKVYCN